MGAAVLVAAEVDCLISLATVARDCNWARPSLTRDNVLDIRQGTRANPDSLYSTFFEIPRKLAYAENPSKSR